MPYLKLFIWHNTVVQKYISCEPNVIKFIVKYGEPPSCISHRPLNLINTLHIPCLKEKCVTVRLRMHKLKGVTCRDSVNQRLHNHGNLQQYLITVHHWVCEAFYSSLLIWSTNKIVNTRVFYDGVVIICTMDKQLPTDCVNQTSLTVSHSQLLHTWSWIHFHSSPFIPEFGNFRGDGLLQMNQK